MISVPARRAASSATRLVRTSLGFVVIAAVCLFFSDIEIHVVDPWLELGRIGTGMLTPDFWSTEQLFRALANTLAFALLGVAIAVPVGGLLALAYRWRLVRMYCAFTRSIHELFWALLLMQLFGLTTLTGVLAIAIPYAGIFAKVYAEILEESDPLASQLLPPGSGWFSSFLYARLPQVYPHLKSYTQYRLECSIRSSAVLGFIGLPTLGFHLETAFSQGLYSQAAALLYLFFVLIFGLRSLFSRSWLLPLYLIAAVLWLPWQLRFDWDLIWRFLTEDMLPAPLRGQSLADPQSWSDLGQWCWMLLNGQATLGILNTLVLSLIAMVATGLVTLVLFPLVSSQFFRRPGRTTGQLLLVIFRSTPELMIAFVALLVFGPSMLPALLALALHNGAVIAHLIGRHSDALVLREDAATGLNRYLFEVLPRVYRQFLAFLFYRWEVILRETAILGILGIHTIGFFIDSAFAELRFDRALFLILIAAALNMGVDSVARWLRLRLKLSNLPQPG
ncbi:MAG: phosphonate transport system permease protein [Motiliproteus sp.]|jgi:phosphonate transport system permease protein